MKYICIKDINKKRECFKFKILWELKYVKGDILDIENEEEFLMLENPDHFRNIIEHRKKVVKKLLENE